MLHKPSILYRERYSANQLRIAFSQCLKQGKIIKMYFEKLFYIDHNRNVIELF